MAQFGIFVVSLIWPASLGIYRHMWPYLTLSTRPYEPKHLYDWYYPFGGGGERCISSGNGYGWSAALKSEADHTSTEFDARMLESIQPVDWDQGTWHSLLGCQVGRYQVPGWTLRTYGCGGVFLGGDGLVPAGGIGGLGRLGRHHCIAVAGGGGRSALSQHMVEGPRVEYIHSSRQALGALVLRSQGFVLLWLDFLPGEEKFDDARCETFDGLEEFSLKHLALHFAVGLIGSRGAGWNSWIWHSAFSDFSIYEDLCLGMVACVGNYLSRESSERETRGVRW